MDGVADVSPASLESCAHQVGRCPTLTSLAPEADLILEQVRNLQPAVKVAVDTLPIHEIQRAQLNASLFRLAAQPEVAPITEMCLEALAITLQRATGRDIRTPLYTQADKNYDIEKAIQQGV